MHWGSTHIPSQLEGKMPDFNDESRKLIKYMTDNEVFYVKIRKFQLLTTLMAI